MKKFISAILTGCLLLSNFSFTAFAAERTAFDENNIIYRFGVVSDVHLSSTWNQEGSKAKFAHMLDVFKKVAGTDADGNTQLDALLVNGDFVDSVNGLGNVNSNTAQYGQKAEQNFNETSLVAKGLWGSDEGGYGNGLDENVKLFYSLGNHDEGGKGKTDYSNANYSTVYSADYFAAIICGWQYDKNSEAALASPDGADDEYREYIADLIDYNTNSATTVNATDFETKYGVSLSDADAKYDRYYGNVDTSNSITDEYGLRYGNRHMIIGEGTDRIHCIAIELSQSADSTAWAKAILDQSVAENPNKPVLIISHYKTKGSSVIGGKLGSAAFAEMLSNYPQAIVWGGHDHSYLHSDAAIDTTNGYVVIDSAATAYAAQNYLTFGNSFGTNSQGNSYVVNANSSSNFKWGNGCYVEIDKNFNVRINRIDVHRSYSADYAKDLDLYQPTTVTSEFIDENGSATSAAIDEAAMIRSPWDITDISTGAHLSDYTNARFNTTSAPYFPEGSVVTATPRIGGLDVTFTMNAKDDGMVYMYVLELWDKDNTEVLKRYYYTNKFYDYPDISQIPETEITHTFNGLDVLTEYNVKVYPVDDFKKAGEAITVAQTTADGKISVDLGDDKFAVFVDSSENAVSEYVYEGTRYTVYNTLKEGIATGADKIYYIAGNNALSTVTSNAKKDIEIVGIDRDNASFYYSAQTDLNKYNYTFTNVSINKQGSGDVPLVVQSGKTLTFNSVKASGYAFNFFSRGYSSATSGSVKITGDTGPVNNIFTGGIYNTNTTTQTGDVNITIEGGTFNGSVGTMKTNASSGNTHTIDGNVFITVTGGTFNGNVSGTVSSAVCPITKNAVVKILGGSFGASGSIGHTGTAQITGKEIYIVKKGIIDSTSYKQSSKGILITVPDSEGGIGDSITDSNGNITGFNIVPVAGKISYVNGTAAATVTVEDAQKYEITYQTANALVFDINGGTGITPDPIIDNPGTVITSLPNSYNFSKEGYEFIGWSLTKDGEVITSAEISSESKILYAVWQSVTEVIPELEVVYSKDFAAMGTSTKNTDISELTSDGWETGYASSASAAKTPMYLQTSSTTNRGLIGCKYSYAAYQKSLGSNFEVSGTYCLTQNQARIYFNSELKTYTDGLWPANGYYFNVNINSSSQMLGLYKIGTNNSSTLITETAFSNKIANYDIVDFKLTYNNGAVSITLENSSGTKLAELSYTFTGEYDSDGYFMIGSANNADIRIFDVEMKALPQYYTSISNVAYNGNNSVKCSAKITNNTDAAKTATVIVSVYDANKKMLGFKIYKDYSLATGSNELTTEVTLTDTTSTPDTIAVMVWNGLNSLVPLSEKTSRYIR